MDSPFELSEQEVHDYVDRAVLGFEPLLDVFPAEEKAGTVPFFATAAMLVAYRRNRPHWWEYLEVIEKALEDVAPLTVGLGDAGLDAVVPVASLPSHHP